MQCGRNRTFVQAAQVPLACLERKRLRLPLFLSIPGKDSTHGLHSAETILTANFTHLSPM